MTTAHPLSPGLRETSVAKNVLWPLPGPCELVPTYTCLFFLFCFVFGGGSNRPRGAGQMWEIDVFGKDFKEMLGGGDIQNLEDSEVSESQVCRTGSPSPRGLQTVPFPGRGLPWSPSRRACCQALRKVAHPPPGCTSSSPPPAPADAEVHSQYLLLFSLPLSPSPLPGKSLQAGRLAGTCCLPCGCQYHPLISARTPCARVRPLRDLALLSKAA